MNLMWVKIQGYKRFFSLSKLDLQGKLIALVGPNEVGKSSILKVLDSLENTELYRKNIELTRGKIIPNAQKIIEAIYLLDDNDFSAIQHITNSEKIKWFSVSKFPDGRQIYNFQEEVYRDLAQREKCVLVIRELISNIDKEVKLAEGEYAYTENEFIELEELRKNAQELLENIETDADDLDEEDLSLMQEVYGSPVLISTTIEIENSKLIIQELEKLHSIESEISPYDEIIDILKKRRPKFITFSQDDNLLESEYDLEEEEIPIALSNLAGYANIDLLNLKENLTDTASLVTITTKANQNLEKLFKWSQSKVKLHLHVEGSILKILVNSLGEYNNIAERSDGLRYYASLTAFIGSQNIKDSNSVLLIDEIENHLHYDAQADLTQMLAKQFLVKKVIYSTHSIGCLPEDLGVGVRIIETEVEGNSESNRSKINNKFWHNHEKGFKPLIKGMGAGSLSFMPYRYGLFSEGATEMILLPTLIKEAINQDYLGFQIIPGLAEAGEGQIKHIDSDRIAYLVDSDSAGNKIFNKLIGAGVDPEKIFDYGKFGLLNAEVEDFIDKDIFCLAINSFIKKWNGVENIFSASLLPETKRMTYVLNKLKEIGENNFSKVSFTYSILDVSDGNPIIEMDKKKILSNLYKEINKLFLKNQKN